MGVYCETCDFKRMFCDCRCSWCCVWFDLICTDVDCEKHREVMAYCGRCTNGDEECSACGKALEPEPE
jgi:hypothetical protein